MSENTCQRAPKPGGLLFRFYGWDMVRKARRERRRQARKLARLEGHCPEGHQYHGDCKQGCPCWAPDQGGQVVLKWRGEPPPPGFFKGGH